MDWVKVNIDEGFSTVEHGSYGPGETEMKRHIAEKYACFVTIIEEEKPKKSAEKVAVKKAATTTAKRRGRKPTKRNTK